MISDWRVPPIYRLRQTIGYKRAEILRQRDEEFAKNGTVITAVDSTVIRDFLAHATNKKDVYHRKSSDNITSSYLGPHLHWASLVSLFKSNYQRAGTGPLLVLPGHIGEVEELWNETAQALTPDDKIEGGESAKALSVEIMSQLDPVDDNPNYSDVASSIQKLLQQHFASIRLSELLSELLDETLVDVSALFEGRLDKAVAKFLSEQLGSPAQLFTRKAGQIGQNRALRWATVHRDLLGNLQANDAQALLSLFILNEILIPHRCKIVLITDARKIIEAAEEYKFFLPPTRSRGFVSGADYCVRDLKVSTNRLFDQGSRSVEGKKHYWADFILEAPTPFPISSDRDFLWHSSPRKVHEFSETIMSSRDYVQSVTDEEEQKQHEYGEETAKGASLSLVETFRDRDVKVADEAALAWARAGWEGLLTLTKQSTDLQIGYARRAFIRSAVLRLVSRHGSEALDGPFKGRFFSCLFLEDSDFYQIACSINELNTKFEARSLLVQRLETASKTERRSQRMDYLMLLGAAALYSDLGYWDQAKLLCDEALLDFSTEKELRGREAHFLLAVCHRMTAQNKEDLQKARENLESARQLAELRNRELGGKLFTGVRFKAEEMSVKAAELAFDTYVSDPRDNIKEDIRHALDKIIDLVKSEAECGQENPRKWARVSLRCTAFSLLLMLKWLGQNDVIGLYKKKIHLLVSDQLDATTAYFGEPGNERVSIRDGLLLIFAAKVSKRRLKREGWIDMLMSKVENDVVTLRKTAAYHPFDSQRLAFLVSIIDQK